MSTPVFDYKRLPVAERIELVGDIWDSITADTPIPAQLSEQDRAELHRRLAAHRADPSGSIPWEQLRAALFKTSAS